MWLIRLGKKCYCYYTIILINFKCSFNFAERRRVYQEKGGRKVVNDNFDLNFKCPFSIKL